MTFQDLELDPRLVDAVSALGFETPTPVQLATIPPALSGKDVIGGARTGSGKTAAYGLPLLHALRDGCEGVGGLVLAPTRELAMQVTEALRDLARNLPLRIACIYGGTPYAGQLQALRKGAQIVVGTPGRVIDLMDRGALKVGKVRHFVLDEADEMLNMGFLEDVERVLAELPAERQIILLSATMPPAIRAVARRTLNDPVQISVESRAMTVDHIEQRWIKVAQRHKRTALARVLAGAPRGSTLVFVRTRKGCAEVADALAMEGLSVDALHGDMNQAARERVLGRFRAQRLDIVAATDVAARGIDVEHITHVINFDLPDDPGVYTHRIGRTGRAGRAGMAISFVTSNEIRKIKAFSRALRVDIVEFDVPTDEDIARRRRDGLAEQLQQALAEDLSVERAMVDSLELSAEDIAAAAIRLISGAQTKIAAVPEARSERYSERYSERTTDRRDHRRAPRDFGQNDEVQLFLPIGSTAGIRASDLVGALANEGGVSGRDIGKVEIKGKVSFVGMSRATAERILARLDQVELRGRTAKVLLARPRDDGPK